MITPLRRLLRLAWASACLLPASLLSSPAQAATTDTGKAPVAGTIEVFGAKIRYHEMGSGPVLLLLHGLGSSGLGDWAAVMPQLATRYRVIALDQLGFGDSEKPMIDYSIQLWVDVLGEFLREQKIEPFALVGESLGGWIAAQYTIQALQGIAADPALALPKPQRLVLCDAAGHRATMEQLFAPPKTGREGPPPLSLAGQKAALASVFYGPQHQTAQALREGMAWSLGKTDTWTVHSVHNNPALFDEALDGRLGAIRIPTLLVWGEHDRLIPVSDGRWFASGIPGSRLELIGDSAHVPMNEAPAAFLRALMPFLAR